jgi:hypothetical protein
MEYDLSFRKDRKAVKIKEGTENYKAIKEALDNLSIVRAKRYFEALGIRFQILSTRNHGSYKYVSFMKTSKQPIKEENENA